MQDIQYIKISCPYPKKHGIYDICGHLLGAIHKDDRNDNFIMYCPSCSTRNNPVFWNVTVNNQGEINLKLIKGARLHFLKTWQTVSR